MKASFSRAAGLLFAAFSKALKSCAPTGQSIPRVWLSPGPSKSDPATPEAGSCGSIPPETTR